jgi:hypothetical protein
MLLTVLASDQKLGMKIIWENFTEDLRTFTSFEIPSINLKNSQFSFLNFQLSPQSILAVKNTKKYQNIHDFHFKKKLKVGILYKSQGYKRYLMFKI